METLKHGSCQSPWQYLLLLLLEGLSLPWSTSGNSKCVYSLRLFDWILKNSSVTRFSSFSMLTAYALRPNKRIFLFQDLYNVLSVGKFSISAFFHLSFSPTEHLCLSCRLFGSWCQGHKEEAEAAKCRGHQDGGEEKLSVDDERVSKRRRIPDVIRQLGKR